MILFFKGGDGETCRLGYKRPLQEKSMVIQLKRSLQDEIEIHHTDLTPVQLLSTGDDKTKSSLFLLIGAVK